MMLKVGQLRMSAECYAASFLFFVQCIDGDHVYGYSTSLGRFAGFTCDHILKGYPIVLEDVTDEA